MKHENEALLPSYPQSGVANTCRSYEEYVAMFALGDRVPEGPVLDVAGGASSFVAALRARGVDASAADPFYAGDREGAIAGARAEIAASTAKLAAMAGSMDWSFYGSPERHRELRERSLEAFAADYRLPDASRRYVGASLPHLPFADGTFGLIVCSHFLFLYGDQLDRGFHRAAIAEMLRLLKPGGELRIYPLVTLQWEIYPDLEELLNEFAGAADISMEPSGLPFVPVPSSLALLAKKG